MSADVVFHLHIFLLLKTDSLLLFELQGVLNSNFECNLR